MLKKLKMTTFAVVLCLFGFVLVPAAPAWAGVSNNVIEFQKCVKTNKGKPVKKVKCFKAVTKNMIQEQQDLCNEFSKPAIRNSCNSACIKPEWPTWIGVAGRPIYNKAKAFCD